MTLELTAKCNFRCPYCYCVWHEYPALAKPLLDMWEEKNRKPCPAGKSFGVIGPNGLYRTCLHSLPKAV